MRLFIVPLAVIIFSAALAVSCGDDDEPDEDTLEGCVAAHTEEGLSEVDAIAECLYDELRLDFASQADCEAYVSENGGFEESRVAGCEAYFDLFPVDAGP